MSEKVGFIVFTHKEATRWKVAGLSLLERAVKTFQRAGIEEIFLVGVEDSPGGVKNGAPEKAVNFLKQSHRVAVVLRGEVVCEPEVIREMLSHCPCVVFPDDSQEKWGLLCAHAEHFNENVWKELFQGGAPRELFSLRKIQQDKVWGFAESENVLKEISWMVVRSTARKVSDGIISRNINRPVSARITYMLVGRVSPWTMTLLSFFSGLFSALIAVFSPPLGGVLLQLNSILDGVDGEMSRATLSASPLGGWMDSIMDRYVDVLFLLALIPHLPSEPWTLFLVGFTVLGAVMVSYSTEKYSASFRSDIYEEIPRLRYLPGKRDERIFLTMLFCLADKPLPLYVVLALITHFRVGVIFYVVFRRKRGV